MTRGRKTRTVVDRVIIPFWVALSVYTALVFTIGVVVGAAWGEDNIDARWRSGSLEGSYPSDAGSNPALAQTLTRKGVVRMR